VLTTDSEAQPSLIAARKIMLVEAHFSDEDLCSKFYSMGNDNELNPRVGRKSGPISRRLWTKVRQIKRP